MAGLVCTVQSSYIDPPEPSRPPIPPAEPAQYGNHIEQVCGIKIGGGWTYDGTCQFPVSVDQCENGMSVRTKSWSKRPCPVDESSVSEEDEDEPRRKKETLIQNHFLRFFAKKTVLFFLFSDFFFANLSRVSMLHSPSVRSWFSRALPKQLQELSRGMVNVRIFFNFFFTSFFIFIFFKKKG